MKYLCLTYHEEKKFDALSKSELEEVMGKCKPFKEALQKSGQVVLDGSLVATQATTTVRTRNGKVLITDGPFAETKEQLAGYYLIEAKDLDEAMAIAARVPSARFGSVEVRPVMEE